MDLEEKVKNLEEKINHLNNMILRMSICKLEDPRYPYYNFISTLNLSDEKKEKIELVLAIFSMRLKKEKIPQEYKINIEDVPFELIYNDKLPTFKEFQETIKKILNIQEKSLSVKLLKTMYAEGRQVEIRESLLEQIEENIFLD